MRAKSARRISPRTSGRRNSVRYSSKGLRTRPTCVTSRLAPMRSICACRRSRTPGSTGALCCSSARRYASIAFGPTPRDPARKSKGHATSTSQRAKTTARDAHRCRRTSSLRPRCAPASFAELRARAELEVRRHCRADPELGERRMLRIETEIAVANVRRTGDDVPRLVHRERIELRAHRRSQNGRERQQREDADSSDIPRRNPNKPLGHRSGSPTRSGRDGAYAPLFLIRKSGECGTWQLQNYSVAGRKAVFHNRRHRS